MHPKQAKPQFPVAKAGSFMHPFFSKTKILDAKPKNQRKNLHTKTQGTGILVARVVNDQAFLYNSMVLMYD